MKKVDFRQLSSVRCSHVNASGQRCPRILKMNLVLRNPEAKLCYRHWVLENLPHIADKRLHGKAQICGQ